MTNMVCDVIIVSEKLAVKSQIIICVYCQLLLSIKISVSSMLFLIVILTDGKGLLFIFNHLINSFLPLPPLSSELFKCLKKIIKSKFRKGFQNLKKMLCLFE